MSPKNSNLHRLSSLGVQQQSAENPFSSDLQSAVFPASSQLGPAPNPADGLEDLSHCNIPVVVLTIVEAASIVECAGAEPSYRYDLPAVGVRDGWAIEALWQQCCDSAQCEREDLIVELIAPDDIAQVLAISAAQEFIELRAPGIGHKKWATGNTPEFADSGTSSDLEETIFEPAAGQNSTTGFRTILRRPNKSPRFSKIQRLQVLGYMGIGLIVILVLVGCFWFLDNPARTPPELSAQSAATADASASSDANPTVPNFNTPRPNVLSPNSLGASASAMAPPSAAGVDDVDLELETYEHSGISVRLPKDFAFYEDTEDTAVVIAQDKANQMRIHFAKDPAYNTPPEEAHRILGIYIDAEDFLELVDPISNKDGLHYIETATDGSRTQWVVFSDTQYVYSIGCQSKQALTAVQMKVCKVAQETAEFS